VWNKWHGSFFEAGYEEIILFKPCSHRELLDVFFFSTFHLPDSLRVTLETMRPPELERSLDVGVTSTGKSLA
jgi:hypothetical protein